LRGKTKLHRHGTERKKEAAAFSTAPGESSGEVIQGKQTQPAAKPGEQERKGPAILQEQTQRNSYVSVPEEGPRRSRSNGQGRGDDYLFLHTVVTNEKTLLGKGKGKKPRRGREKKKNKTEEEGEKRKGKKTAFVGKSVQNQGLRHLVKH